MPRKARRMSEYGFMHIIVRGIGRQLLFEDKSDYGYYHEKVYKLFLYPVLSSQGLSLYSIFPHLFLLAYHSPF